MIKEIHKTSAEEQYNTKINELVAAYSQMFLSDIDRKLTVHLGNKVEDEVHIWREKTWDESDLV